MINRWIPLSQRNGWDQFPNYNTIWRDIHRHEQEMGNKLRLVCFVLFFLLVFFITILLFPEGVAHVLIGSLVGRRSWPS